MTKVTSLELFIEKANKVHYNEYDYSQSIYVNSKTKLKVICKDHGQFLVSSNNHLRGRGCPRCKFLKKEQTSIKLYGHKNYNNRAKAADTMCEKYGASTTFASEVLSKKVELTKIKKYGDKNYNNRVKGRQTCLKRYGVENFQQLETVRIKTEETNMSRYGVKAPAQNPEILEKIHNTNFDRYGVKTPMEYDAHKVSHMNACLNSFGETSPMQNKESLVKQQRSAFRLKIFVLPSNKEIKLQGFEPQVLNFLLKTKYNEVDFEFENIPSFSYYDEHEYKRKYFPDFFIPSEKLIIEVKSNWTFKKYEQRNLCKKRAVINSGFNFTFMIWDNNQLRII